MRVARAATERSRPHRRRGLVPRTRLCWQRPQRSRSCGGLVQRRSIRAVPAHRRENGISGGGLKDVHNLVESSVCNSDGGRSTARRDCRLYLRLEGCHDAAKSVCVALYSTPAVTVPEPVNRARVATCKPDIARVVPPERNDSHNAVGFHQANESNCLERVRWREPEDVIVRDGQVPAVLD